MKIADINGDGSDDILLGNYGLNSKLTAGSGYPLLMYSKSFTGVNSADQIIALARDKKYYPFLTKEIIERQLPFIKKEFLQYSEMAGKTVEEVFGSKLKDAAIFKADTLASVACLMTEKGIIILHPCPWNFNGRHYSRLLSTIMMVTVKWIYWPEVIFLELFPTRGDMTHPR